MAEDIGDHSFTGRLLKKLSYTKGVNAETGKNTNAAMAEVRRQIKQAASDPITGKNVTKSGPED